MRVISQEGFCYQDIPYERSAFYMSTFGTHIYANCNGVVYSLAEYSTADKAEKAMQKLHEAYAPEPLFIHKDVSPDERAAAGEISWAQALDEMHTGMFVRPIPDSSIEQVYTGNVVFRFPQEDEL